MDSPCLNTRFLCVTPLTKFRCHLHGAANSYSSQDVADKRGQVRVDTSTCRSGMAAAREWTLGHSRDISIVLSQAIFCWWCFRRTYNVLYFHRRPKVIYRTDLISCCTSHVREKIIAIFISISCLTWPVVTTHFAYSLSSGNLIEIFLSNSLRFVLCPEVLLSLFPSGTY